MASNGQRKLLTNLLNIPDIKVIDMLQETSIGKIFIVENLNSEATCPHCGQVSHHLHQNNWYLIKDLPMSGENVYLKINRRRFKCFHCSTTFNEALSYCDKNRQYTKRLASEILNQVKDSNIKSVAERTGVTEAEIETMLADFKKKLAGQKPEKLKRLGIDEISIKKGQGNYCAVLVDLDRGKLLALVSERTQEAIEKVLLSWGKEVLEGIEEVSIDLWFPYKTLSEKIIPNASVVADRFHVMNQIQEELNNGRKSAKHQVNKMSNSPEKAAKLKAINGSKFVLLKNRKNLSDSQNLKKEEVLNKFPVLNEMCALKDEFQEIFESSNSWFDGLVKLRDWLKKSANLFPKSQGTVRRWLVEITAYFESKTSNGVVEGVNQKIKLIKRAGFGFRNQANFELRCLLNFLD